MLVDRADLENRAIIVILQGETSLLRGGGYASQKTKRLS